MSARACRGTSVVEALWALLLALVVATLSLLLLARQRAVQAGLTQRIQVLTAVRTTRHVLGVEIRAVQDPATLSVFAPDSIRLRVFRGGARVCFVPGWDALVVAVEGVRLPDPTKDSVLLLDADGVVHVRGIRSDAAVHGRRPACGPGRGRLRDWRLSDSVPAGVVAGRYFERGSYHINGGALRYRRGRGGRQPLTPAVLATPPSAFAARPGRSLSVDLWSSGGGDGPWPLSFMPSPR